jgi:hypothetical protein
MVGRIASRRSERRMRMDLEQQGSYIARGPAGVVVLETNGGVIWRDHLHQTFVPDKCPKSYDFALKLNRMTSITVSTFGPLQQGNHRGLLS